MSAGEAAPEDAPDGELTRAEALVAKLWDDLASLRSLHEREVAQLRRDYEERVGEMRRQLSEARGGEGDPPADDPDVDEVRARLDAVEEELEDVYDSETWKVGRALVYLPRRAKQALRQWWQERPAGPG